MPVVRPAQVLVNKFLVDKLLEASNLDEEDSFSLLDWSQFFPNSTAIQRVQHRLRDGSMLVRFANRAPTDYLFGNVPRELFRQWKRVQSPGKFYHRRIKNNYFAGGGLSA